MKHHQLIPAFSPVYHVYFFSDAQCVFFLNEYPLPDRLISDARLFDLLYLIDGTQRISDLAQKVERHFSVQQVQDILEQLHQKKLVVFS